MLPSMYIPIRIEHIGGGLNKLVPKAEHNDGGLASKLWRSYQ